MLASSFFLLNYLDINKGYDKIILIKTTIFLFVNVGIFNPGLIGHKCLRVLNRNSKNSNTNIRSGV